MEIKTENKRLHFSKWQMENGKMTSDQFLVRTSVISYYKIQLEKFVITRMTAVFVEADEHALRIVHIKGSF